MAVDKARVFRDVTLAVCSTLDIQEGLLAALRRLARSMPAEVMYLMVVERELSALRPMAFVTRRGIKPLPEPALVPLPEEALRFITSKATGKAYRLADARQAPPMVVAGPALGLRGPVSAMNMKLAVGEAQVGSLGVAASGLDRFTAEHARLLEAIQQPVAIALLNAMRFQETERLRGLLAEENRTLREDMRRVVGDRIVGAEAGLREVMDAVRSVAPLKSAVLLLGETGTGKELVARAVHRHSPRRDGPFIAVNCGAIPENLVESELFGHERGAFTGAEERRRGRIERADGGTLFLDEIGDLPLSAQVQLLRVLQTFELERVGGATTIRVDARVIAATHRDLEAMVRRGTFREDLWYRLNVFPLRIPPLRQRIGDVPALVEHFLRRKAEEMNLPELPTLAPEAMDQLRAYRWPGNVRELQNVVERALILHRGAPLRFPELSGSSEESPTVCETPGEAPSLRPLDAVIREHCRRVLSHTGGRVEGAGGAAEILEVQPNTLRARLRKLGLPFGRSWGGLSSTRRFDGRRPRR